MFCYNQIDINNLGGIMKLNAAKLGIAAGIVWGIYVFSLSLMAETGYALGIVQALGNLYIGDSASFGGALIGFVEGFLDAFVGFYLIGLIYNMLTNKD